VTLDEKLKEIEFRLSTATYVGFSSSAQAVILELNIENNFLLAALKRCREQRDYYQDQLCDLDVGSYGTPIEDDAELLALLEGEKT